MDHIAAENASTNAEIQRIEQLMCAINKQVKDPETNKLIPPVIKVPGAEFYSVKFPKE